MGHYLKKAGLFLVLAFSGCQAFAAYLPGATEGTQLGVKADADQIAAALGAQTATVTGTITTQNLNPTGTATAGSAVEITLSNTGVTGVQVTGSYTAANGLSFYGTIDGTNYTAISGPSCLYSGSTQSPIPFGYIGNGGTGTYMVIAPGFKKLRITSTGAVSGTATITMNASIAPITGNMLTSFVTTQTLLANRVFKSGTVTQAAGGAGTYATIQFYNPAGSGVTGWFAVGILNAWAASGTVALRYNASARATNVGAGTNWLPGGANSSVIIYKEAIASLPTDYNYGPLAVSASYTGTSMLGIGTNLYFIPEGQGIEIIQQTANVALNAFAVWGEYPNK